MTLQSLEAKVANLESRVEQLEGRPRVLDQPDLPLEMPGYVTGSAVAWKPAWFWKFFDTWTLKKQVLVSIVISGPIWLILLADKL